MLRKDSCPAQAHGSGESSGIRLHHSTPPPSQPGPQLCHFSGGRSAASGPLPLPPGFPAWHTRPSVTWPLLTSPALSSPSPPFAPYLPKTLDSSHTSPLSKTLTPHPPQRLCAPKTLCFLQGLTQVRLSLRGGPENVEHTFLLTLYRHGPSQSVVCRLQGPLGPSQMAYKFKSIFNNNARCHRSFSLWGHLQWQCKAVLGRSAHGVAHRAAAPTVLVIANSITAQCHREHAGIH